MIAQAPTTEQTATVPAASAVPDRIGGTVEFGYVRADLLKIDPVYQRGVNYRRVADIVAKFDPDVFHAITVSIRDDGDHFVIDGQHRTQAVWQHFTDRPAIEVPCLIHRHLTEAEEAKLFYKLNRHRLQPTAGDAFKARLAFGEDVAIAIKASCDRHGVVVSFWGSNARPNECVAIAQLEILYTAGRLDAVLDLIGAAWPAEPGAYKQKYLAGLNRFLVDFAPWLGGRTPADLATARRERLVDVLHALGTRDLDKGAGFFAETAKSAPSEAISRAIHKGFNDGARGKLRLPPWGAEPSPIVPAGLNEEAE